MVVLRIALLPLFLLAGCAVSSAAPGRARPLPTVVEPPAAAYWAYVVSESADLISVIRFDAGGAELVRTIPIGMVPTEINGPHGIAVSPDREHYFASVGHGSPFGTLWKYRAAGDELLGRITLGLFPASLDVSPDGQYVYVANFNLHGDMVPSSVSVVDAGQMVEVARITTCTMPHGSRFSRDGSRHYSTCMMDDLLVEIDTRTFEVSRHFHVAKGEEHGRAGAPHVMEEEHQHHEVSCSPTWAHPSPDGSRVYVACNRSDEIVVVDADTWELVRRIPAGTGVYNVDVTPDGRLLIATNKGGQSVSVFDVESARELARIPTRRPVVHGIAVSPDSRYAFISVEGVGSEPGTVEIIDLRALRSVAAVDVGQQAAGIVFWRMEER